LLGKLKTFSPRSRGFPAYLVRQKALTMNAAKRFRMFLTFPMRSGSHHINPLLSWLGLLESTSSFVTQRTGRRSSTTNLPIDSDSQRCLAAIKTSSRNDKLTDFCDLLSSIFR
jgi:hypothetical protein